MIHPHYSPIIGSKLLGFYVENWKLTLDFSKNAGEDEEVSNYELGTTSRLCSEKSQIFHPISDDMVMENHILPLIYQAIEKPVLDFIPLSMGRACQLDFEGCSLFVWANKEPSYPLFYAKAFGLVDGDYKQIKYWEIDDV